jgi:hypothetical protein
MKQSYRYLFSPGTDDDNVDDVIEALSMVITAYAIGTPAAAFATAC